MALRNAQVDILLNKDNPDWVNQAQFACPALELAIRELNIRCRTFVTVIQLAAKRTDKSGVGNNIKCLVRVAMGDDQAETFLNGNDVAHALINPLLKATVDRHLEILAGTPSTVLEIDNALNQALITGAPGLIGLPPEGGGFIELEFVVLAANVGVEFLSIRPLQDMPDPCDAQINWSETPKIVTVQLPGGPATFEEHRNDMTGPANFVGAGFNNPILGDWTYTNTNVMVDEASPPGVTDTMVHVIDTKARTITQTWDAENSPGTDVGTQFSFGLVNDVVNLCNTVQVFESPSFRGVFNAMSDPRFPTGGIFKSHNELPTNFRKFDSIVNSILINNNTGVTIPAGTELGQMLIAKGAIQEVF